MTGEAKKEKRAAFLQPFDFEAPPPGLEPGTL